MDIWETVKDIKAKSLLLVQKRIRLRAVKTETSGLGSLPAEISCTAEYVSTFKKGPTTELAGYNTVPFRALKRKTPTANALSICLVVP